MRCDVTTKRKQGKHKEGTSEIDNVNTLKSGLTIPFYTSPLNYFSVFLISFLFNSFLFCLDREWFSEIFFSFQFDVQTFIQCNDWDEICATSFHDFNLLLYRFIEICDWIIWVMAWKTKSKAETCWGFEETSQGWDKFHFSFFWLFYSEITKPRNEIKFPFTFFLILCFHIFIFLRLKNTNCSIDDKKKEALHKQLDGTNAAKLKTCVFRCN